MRFLGYATGLNLAANPAEDHDPSKPYGRVVSIKSWDPAKERPIIVLYRWTSDPNAPGPVLTVLGHGPHPWIDFGFAGSDLFVFNMEHGPENDLEVGVWAESIT